MNNARIVASHILRSRLSGIKGRGFNTSSVSFGINRLPAGQHTIPESREKVEISTSTAEWQFVERVLPMTKIPAYTAKPGEVMPSGWKAPSAQPGDYPYYIRRNANHMLPVYVKHVPLLTRFTTTVNHIEGDIFALADELRDLITKVSSRKFAVLQVVEPHRMIKIRGKYYQEVKDFLLDKGF